MMVVSSPSVEKALRELQELAPNAPLLALGQTVFWDEPMKAGIVAAGRRLGFDRRFVAGVHDTDYFAKLPSGKHQAGKFKPSPTTTPLPEGCGALPQSSRPSLEARR